MSLVTLPFKWIFPQNLSHPTLAFLGLIYPLHGGDSSHVIAEMQARYVCQVS